MTENTLGNKSSEFFIYGSCFEYCDYMVNDAVEFCNVHYFNKRIMSNNRFINFLFRMHFSTKLNRFFNLPFKSIWNHRIVDKKLCSKEGPNFFIFFDSNIHTKNISLLKYIKKKIPNSYLVLYFYNSSVLSDNYDIDFYKKYFDRIYTFSFDDSIKYGLSFVPGFYSYAENKIDNFDTIDSDIFYVGQAKGREELIILAYNELTRLGFKVDFNVINASCDLPNGIKTKRLSYEEVIKRTKHTRCVLDISNNLTKGLPLRFLESLFYKKHFITDNLYFKETKYYECGFIDIIDFKNTISKEINIDIIPNDCFKEDFSFKKFLIEIEELF